MFQVAIPFEVTAFLVVSVLTAASMGFAYLIVTIAMNRIAEPVLPLPDGVTALCNLKGCGNPATQGLKEVVDELTERGEYRYLSGGKVPVYCGKHQPTFSNQHQTIRIVATVAVWVCLVWAFFATIPR